jgi:hypothetical protein
MIDASITTPTYSGETPFASVPLASIPTIPPRHSPATRRSAEAIITEDEGQKYRVALGRDAGGKPCEVFIDVIGKSGSALQRHVEVSAILASLLMQYGVPISVIVHSIAGPLATALSLLDEGGPPMT